MPACARQELVRHGEIGTYHCVQRCVRRAFLCGEDFATGRNHDHRKIWVKERLQHLAHAFAAEVAGYAVMSNHVHVMVRTRPDIALTWNATELAGRWWQLFPKRRDEAGFPAVPTEDERQAILDQRGGGEDRIQELRTRLASLSWFMRCFAEPIARRANHEDGCTGRFWQGRFTSQALLDEAAVLACLVYIDLNPIRAGIAATPEASAFTSAQDRIVARQAAHKLRAASAQSPKPVPQAQRKRVAQARRNCSRASWLARLGGKASFLPRIDLDAYLKLLDWTGRQLVHRKRGSVPGDLRPILERLQLDVSHWVETAWRFSQLFHRVAGAAQRIADEASRVGRRWLQGSGAAKRVYAT